MKNKYIAATVCIILLIVLSVLYFSISDNAEQNANIESEETNPFAEEQYKYMLINEDSENIEYITLDYNSGLTIISDPNNDGKWLIKNFENVSLNQSAVQSVVSGFAFLGTDEKIETENINLAEYGLENPVSTVKVKTKNGNERTIFLGNSTPDKEYYYASIDGDSSVYIIPTVVGNRFTYTMNDFIDKTLAPVSPYALTYIDVIQKDKDEIEIEYTAEKSGNAAELHSMGMDTLRMNKPIDGAVVYPTNLQETLLTTLQNIELGTLVEIYPQNLSKYGLDFPSIEITAKDQNNSLYLKIGNENENGQLYCTANNNEHVFLIEKSYIEPFLNADIYKFIEKFVGMHYRSDINGVDIKYDNKIISITFGEEEQDKNLSEEEKEKLRFSDNRKTYINGKEIDKETFAEFYELLIGIKFDNIDASAVASSLPEITITYKLKDNTTDEIKFYNYNESFYLADNTKIKGCLVNKQSVKSMIKKAETI